MYDLGLQTVPESKMQKYCSKLKIQNVNDSVWFCFLDFNIMNQTRSPSPAMSMFDDF